MMRIKNGYGETFSDYPDDESLAVIVYFVGCKNNIPVNCSV